MFNIHLITNLPRNLPLRNFWNRLRFNRVMVMSLWPTFFGPPCLHMPQCAHADRQPLPSNIYSKSVFGFLRRLSTWHCPHLLLSAVACYRVISPVRGALSSKPAARRCCRQSMGQTDRRTDRRTLDHFIDQLSILCVSNAGRCRGK